MLESFRIAFHNMAPPFGADELVRDNALELERLLGRSIACNVTVEKRHRHNSRGNLFHIAIELLVSNRSFALRAFSSGPWHAKHCPERIGRISWYRCTLNR